jgi:serine phosphatase RsbU (regulator of sigma subunit)/CHASE2 domain-containing sensor protein
MTALERKVFVISAIVGTATTLLVMLADRMGWMSGLEKWTYDRRMADCQFFRKPPTTQIVHMDIDDRSLEAIGRWPWPRDRFAAILDEIGRAKPKVVGIDIVYSEPADLRVERVGPNKTIDIDEDRAMSETLARMGNVVIPVSLKLAPSKSVTALESAVRAELTANLEITQEQLTSRLRVRGFPSDQVQQSVAEQYYPARRQAMYDRILLELKSEDLTWPELFKRLLPTTDFELKSPLKRTLEEQYKRVQAWQQLQRFTLPMEKGMPAPLATIPNELPIPSYSAGARACGFADDNLTEPVVRSMPMFVECDGRIFAQWGLAFACVLADADLHNARITDASAVIPSASGDITVPLRWQYSANAGRDVPLIANLSWFGTHNWQTMYDWPKHEEAVNHLPINQVWDILQTQERIRTNNASIDLAIFKIMDEPAENDLRLRLDPAVAKRYRAAIPSLDDPIAREKIANEVLGVVKDFGVAEQLAAITDPTPEEKAKKELVDNATKAMRVGVEENRKLATQLASYRGVLADAIGGKGVLIGWTATGAVDMVTTSLHSRCPGVVVHGAIANAFLTRQWFRSAPTWITALLTLALGIGIALATGRLSPPVALTTAIIATIAYFLINGVLLFDWGHWIVGAAAPMVAIMLAWSGATVARLITEGVDRIRRERDLAVFRHEMSLAKNVQVALIPKEMPKIDGIEPFGWTKPADETGGDLFDLWTLPDGRLGILVADASGHGLAPSVIVSQVRTLVRALSEIEKHPNGLLARVNARLAQDLEPARFVTAFLGFLDSNGTIEWASAGHGPMLWCTKDGEEFQSLDATALPLGIMEDYMGDEIGPLQLEISGMLIVTSDGIFEAPNATDEQFGIERVIETLKQYQGASTIEISSAIREAVTKWQRNPDKPVDDQTTVIIRRVASGLNVTIVEDKATAAAVS